MEKALSPIEEQKLASAVEKAATLANANNKLDRNALLADCLNEAGVPSKLAKTASAAFNRRVTVLTFQKTADEHKIDSFPLTDSTTVTELMGGKTLKKSASYVAPTKSNFYISLSDKQPVMKKTASAKSVPAPKPLEERLNWGLFERHLESMLQKQAAEHTRLIGDLHKMRADIERRRIKIGEALTKSASFTQQTFYNLFGDAVTDYLGKDYKPSIRLWKTASFAVDPDTELSRQFKRLVADTDHCIALNDAIADYQQGLAEFSKTAADFSNHIHKACLNKTAGIISTMLVRGALPTAVETAGILGEKVTEATNVGIDALNKALASAHQAPKSYSPSDVLTSSFLLKDRAQDRMMAWADMAADPLLSQYKASEVFNAAQKIMDVNPELESPAKRELLRAYVSQVLAQNNRLSTADLASLGAVLRDQNNITSNIAKQLAAAKALKNVEGKDYGATTLDHIELRLKSNPDAYSKALDKLKEDIKAQDASTAYNKTAPLKAEQFGADQAKAEAEQAVKAREQALKALKIKSQTVLDPASGDVTIQWVQTTGSGKKTKTVPVSDKFVDKAVENYIRLNTP